MSPMEQEEIPPEHDGRVDLILALDATVVEWKRSVREWPAVKSRLAIVFEERFPMEYRPNGVPKCIRAQGYAQHMPRHGT